MDAISYSYADKAHKRIKRFIENPDSTSGIVTVPKTIASGETVTVPAGRVAVLPNVQVDGMLNIEGEVFIPSGATLSRVVETTGNQTIAGVKTFSSSPIVPTPTTGTQAVNKDYADLKVALAQFTGTNVSLTGNGYQKLPGGLIIQWGNEVSNLSANVSKVVIFPIAFPSGIFIAPIVSNANNANNSIVSSGGSTSSSFNLFSTGSGIAVSWVAVGY